MTLSREILHRMIRAYHEDGVKGEELPRSFGVDSRSAYLGVYASEVEVYPHVRLEPTPADVAAACEGCLPPSRLIAGEHPQLRWERIAGRAGITPAGACSCIRVSFQEV